MAHQSGSYDGFCRSHWVGIFLPYLDGMQVNATLPLASIKIDGTHLYTGWSEALWGQSVLPKNTTPCPRPGLEPGLLDPETSTLTVRSLRCQRVVNLQTNEMSNLKCNKRVKSLPHIGCPESFPDRVRFSCRAAGHKTKCCVQCPWDKNKAVRCWYELLIGTTLET